MANDSLVSQDFRESGEPINAADLSSSVPPRNL